MNERPVVLRISIMGSSELYWFHIESRDDTQAYSFRVLADLVYKLADIILDEEPSRTLEPKATHCGEREWVFEYTQREGTLQELETLASVECGFVTTATSKARCVGALRAFEVRLLQEPDVDEPCFHGIGYTMSK